MSATGLRRLSNEHRKASLAAFIDDASRSKEHDDGATLGS
jgi:hypothetical protein